MENNDNCSYKYLTEDETKKTIYANNSSGGEVYLSRERQEQIKNMMFSALQDPRHKLKTITVDEMTKKWIVPEIQNKTINSN